MAMNDSDSNAVQMSYTVTPRFAIGVQHEYFIEDSVDVDAVTLDFLVKRWNFPAAQANFYLRTGTGIAYNNGETDPAAFAGIDLDWENRRFFMLYENRFLTAGDTESFATHRARVGVAPYIGDYGDLHTWLMLQTDYKPGESDDFSVTPLVRLFKGTTLVEAGYNLDGGFLFNLTQQF